MGRVNGNREWAWGMGNGNEESKCYYGNGGWGEGNGVFFLVEGGSFTRNKVGRGQYCNTVDQYHLRRGTPLTPSFSFQQETSV